MSFARQKHFCCARLRTYHLSNSNKVHSSGQQQCPQRQRLHVVPPQAAPIFTLELQHHPEIGPLPCHRALRDHRGKVDTRCERPPPLDSMEPRQWKH